MVKIFTALLNPGVAGMVFLLGLCLWIITHPKQSGGPKLLLMIFGVLAFGPLSEAVMNFESDRTPWKYDFYLYLIDNTLGLSAFQVARLLSEPVCSALYLVYQSLWFVMILWYALHLSMEKGTPGKLLTAYALLYVLGPCVYLLVPARGPRHAFPLDFPMGAPDVAAVLTPLSGWPNAIPSLHVATALLFLSFSAGSRLMRRAGALYLAGTVAATLAFEHYTIDLIVALPFAAFAALVAKRDFPGALINFVMVLAWLVTIRLATPALLLFPELLRFLPCITVMLSVATTLTAVPAKYFGQSAPLGPADPAVRCAQD